MLLVEVGARNADCKFVAESVYAAFASADEAVKAASRMAEAGDVVLLSPCCASFDLFENYEDRGRKFKEAVRRL